MRGVNVARTNHGDLRVHSPAELRRIARAGATGAYAAWSHALARGDAGHPLQSLLGDWGEWSGLDHPTMLRTIVDAQARADAEWAGVDPHDPDDVAAFYDRTTTIIPLLLWWHATEPAPARCAAAAAGVLAGVGARRVLDYGSGIGSTSLLLAARGMDPILADVARQPLAFAEWRLGVRGHEVETLDLLSGGLDRIEDATLDGIVAFDVFEHLPEPESSLTELDRALKPGGVLCCNQVYLPREGEVPEHYPRRGEILRWLHQHGYRLAHSPSLCWIAQKAPLPAGARRRQGMSLRMRLAAAGIVDGRRGPIGRGLAFHTIRHAVR